MCVRIVPNSVTTPVTRPACSSSPRAAQFWRTVPPRIARAMGDQRGRPFGIGDANRSARRCRPSRICLSPCHAPSPPRIKRVAHHAEVAGEAGPFRPGFDLGIVIRQIQQPAPTEAEVLVRGTAQVFPECQALRRHRQFAGVAILLAAPAPIAARLLGAHPPLLDHRDLESALRQKKPAQMPTMRPR